VEKLEVKNSSFVHLTVILLLHYLLNYRSRSLAVYNHEFILCGACVGSETLNEGAFSLRALTRVTLVNASSENAP